MTKRTNPGGISQMDSLIASLTFKQEGKGADLEQALDRTPERKDSEKRKAFFERRPAVESISSGEAKSFGFASVYQLTLNVDLPITIDAKREDGSLYSSVTLPQGIREIYGEDYCFWKQRNDTGKIILSIAFHQLTQIQLWIDGNTLQLERTAAREERNGSAQELRIEFLNAQANSSKEE